MTSIVVAMVVIMLIVTGTAGLVVVGMQGRGRGRAPGVARRFARAAQHLNGEAQPPRRLVRLFEHAQSR